MDGAVGWPAGCDTAWRPTYKALSRNPPIVAGEVTSALMRVTSLDTQRACVELKTAGTRHAAAYLHSDLGYRLVDDLVCRPLLWIATRDDRSGNRGAGTSSTFEEGLVGHAWLAAAHSAFRVASRSVRSAIAGDVGVLTRKAATKGLGTLVCSAGSRFDIKTLSFAQPSLLRPVNQAQKIKASRSKSARP